MKYLIAFVLIAVVGVVAYRLYFSAPPLPRAGDSFANAGELVQRLKAHGYVEMGKFSPEWPAIIVDIQQQQDGIAFTVNGQAQKYESPAYVGYDFVFYRFVSSKKKSEFGYLFKTVKKVR